MAMQNSGTYPSRDQAKAVGINSKISTGFDTKTKVTAAVTGKAPHTPGCATSGFTANVISGFVK